MNRVLLVLVCCFAVAALATEAPNQGGAQGTSRNSMAAKPTARNAASKDQPRSYNVQIKDFAFGPAALKVPIGATVVWTNKDEEPHTVHSTDDLFKSKALDTDEAFSFTFTHAGTYKYFCSVHPKMVATIVVAAQTDEKRP